MRIPVKRVRHAISAGNQCVAATQNILPLHQHIDIAGGARPKVAVEITAEHGSLQRDDWDRVFLK